MRIRSGRRFMMMLVSCDEVGVLDLDDGRVAGHALEQVVGGDDGVLDVLHRLTRNVK